MILAAAHSVSSGLWYWAATASVVGVAMLVILFCVKIAIEIIAEEQRLKRERREDQAKTEARNHHHKKARHE